MYNPDDIERAKAEVAEDALSATEDLKKDMEFYEAMLPPDFSAAEDVIIKETKCGAGLYSSEIMEHDGFLYVISKEETVIDEDGDYSVVRTFSLVTDHDVYDSYKKSQWHYNRRDPLNLKIEKYLDWDTEHPVELPEGAELVHVFPEYNVYNQICDLTRKIYRKNDTFYIKRTLHGHDDFFVLSPCKDSGIYNTVLAVFAAIDENKEKECIRRAKRNLNKAISRLAYGKIKR